MSRRDDATSITQGAHKPMQMHSMANMTQRSQKMMGSRLLFSRARSVSTIVCCHPLGALMSVSYLVDASACASSTLATTAAAIGDEAYAAASFAMLSLAERSKSAFTVWSRWSGADRRSGHWKPAAS